MGATERITKLLQTLPERELTEVLDFTEYLAARRLRKQETDGTPGFLDYLPVCRYSRRYASGGTAHHPRYAGVS